MACPSRRRKHPAPNKVFIQFTLKILIKLHLFLPTVMGKLNIAHHKSYHPYRRDNIEKVRRDEEEARLKEAKEEGRMMLAVSWLQSPPP
jgi:N-terminal domain of CBF1 interacting co-repressor CIR